MVFSILLRKKSIMRIIGEERISADTVSLGGTKSPGRVSWNVIQFPDRFVDLFFILRPYSSAVDIF